MLKWDETDAWILHAATTRGRVNLKILMGTADFTMHTRPTRREISTSVAKFLTADLFHFDGYVVKTGPAAIAVVDRSMRSSTTHWAPDGWIAHILSELPAFEEASSVSVPAGFHDWYDVLAHGRRASVQKLFHLPLKPPAA